jgi:glycerol uptake facilitator-like aquaporin
LAQRHGEQELSYTTGQRLAAEALGTALLVATVVGSGIMAETLSDGNTGLALLANTIATGAILFVLITAFGPVSGAHFNPAVTLVFLLRREIGAVQALSFVFVQVIGGVCGTLLAHAMFDQPLVQVSSHARSGFAQGLSEAVATFALIFAILGTLRARPHAVPVAVALVIMAGYWFTASTSFANPAVAIARAFTDTFSGIAPADLPLFILCEFAGAIAAWLFAHYGMGWRGGPDEEPSLSGELEGES